LPKHNETILTPNIGALHGRFQANVDGKTQELAHEEVRGNSMF